MDVLVCTSFDRQLFISLLQNKQSFNNRKTIKITEIYSHIDIKGLPSVVCPIENIDL